MAVDHALATELEPDAGVLRLYRWDRPTLSFGRNEPSRALYDPELARERNVGLVRRPTGGRAVLHHEELTYGVVLAVGALGGLKETYHRINEALVDAMVALGVPAALAPSTGSALAPDAGPCFDAPAEGEVVAHGRKLVGSAQVRIGRSVLQHGSIILDGDQGLIAELGGPEPSPPATLAGLLGRVPERARLDEAMHAAFRARMGGSWERSDLTPAERDAVAVHEKQYLDPEWTWRR
jgi:lipoate-protein ligase A